jgi:hypothetical protein
MPAVPRVSLEWLLREYDRFLLIDSVWVRTGVGAGGAGQSAIRSTWQLPDLTEVSQE